MGGSYTTWSIRVGDAGPGSTEVSAMDVESRVKQFIVDNFYVSDPSELSGETSLIASGFVDSTGMLELMAFIESEFAIRIDDREATPENLETLARIGDFVARKKAAA